MPADSELVGRVTSAVLGDLEAIADALSAEHPSAPATTFAFGGGRAVFFGPGLFVNRAIGAGLGRQVTSVELDEFEQRTIRLGHAPAVDVSILTDPSLTRLLDERGYEPVNPNTTVVRDLTAVPEIDPAFRIEVVDADSLETWCHATAFGWGHDHPQRRADSNRYAGAAFAAQTPGLLLAFDASDGRVVGCGALAMVGGVALLGGMSVLPGERGRGVQTAMIVHRLHLARELEADIAVTGAASGSQSERNLIRCGFQAAFTTTTQTRS